MSCTEEFLSAYIFSEQRLNIIRNLPVKTECVCLHNNQKYEYSMMPCSVMDNKSSVGVDK